MCALRHRHHAMHRTVAKRGFERDMYRYSLSSELLSKVRRSCVCSSASNARYSLVLTEEREFGGGRIHGRKPCLWRWVRLIGIDYSGAQMPTASLKHYRGHLSGTISALRPLWRAVSLRLKSFRRRAQRAVGNMSVALCRRRICMPKEATNDF